MLVRQTDLAKAAGDKTVTMNDAVAESFKKAAAAAGSSTRNMAATYTSSVDEQVGASDRLKASLDQTAVAARDSALIQARAAEESSVAMRDASLAAVRSADVQKRANEETAASALSSAKSHESAAKRSESAFGSASSGITKAGQLITFGLLGAAAASVDLAVKFQANTTRLQTQAGATAKQVNLLRKGMLDMAAQVGYTPNQLADGMYHVVSSMNAVLPPTQRVTGELRVLRIAAEGAQVGHSNLEETTYALASAMNSLHQPISNTQKVMGTLNAIVGSGDMTMQDLVDALKSGVLPAAHIAGVSLQSLGAAMSVMGDMGMRGALAGTRLRMSIALLSSPSAASAKVLETLGLSAQQATSTSEAMAAALQKAGLRTTQLSADLRRPDGIQVALQDLNTHLRDSGMTATGAAAVMNKAFGGGRMGATITLLADNTGRLNTKFQQIGQTTNQFGHDWAVTQQTTAFQLKSMEAGVMALGTRIGTDLLPYVETGVHDLQAFVKWLEAGSPAAHALEVAVAGFATVAVGSYFTSKMLAAIKVLKEFRALAMAPFTSSGPGLGSLTGNAGASAGLKSAESGGLGIGGAKSGVGLPGSIPDPIIVSMEAGEYAGLGSQGAAGTVSTEANVAKAETGAVAQETGTAAVTTGASAATAAEAGAVSSVMATIKTGLGALLKGGLIAGGGTAVSQMAGQYIGGGAGKAVSDVGTGASIGAGLGSMLGPEGTLAGGITGGLVGGFAAFVSHDASKYGNEIASKVTAPLGPAVAAKFDPQLASTLNKVHDAQSAAAADLHNPLGGLTAQDRKNLADVAVAYQKAGRDAGDAFVAGVQGVKFPSTFQMFMQMREELDAMPARMRDSAAKVMLEYAQTLQDQGKLPKGAVQELIGSLEAQFSGLRPYLQSQGVATAQEFAATMKMSTAVSNTQQLVNTLKVQFGNIFENAKVSSGDLLSTVTDDYNRLQAAMGTMTAQGRQKASQELDALKQTGTADAETLANNVEAQMMNMKGSIVSGSAEAATSATTSFKALMSNIGAAMSAGTVATAKGTQLIAQALNAELKSFGAKPLPPVALQGQSASELIGEANFLTTGSTSSTGGVGHQGLGAATGGWIGSAGEKGPDAIPITVGRGEAVLNHQQQSVVNGALSQTGVGSLDQVFSMTSGSRHYMAAGGVAGGGSTQPPTYVYPIPGFTVGRTDMGVDADAAPGAPIGAIGDSTLVGIIPNWYAGQPLLDFQLTDGPDAGRYWYVAEEIVPVTETRGATFKAGQAVAHFAPSGTGIEIGWAGDAIGNTLAQSTGQTGDSSHGNAPAGVAFRAFLGGLAHGVITGGGPGGGGSAFSAIKTPKVTGTGTLATIVQAALGLDTKAANAYGQAHAPSGGIGGIPGGLTGPVPAQMYQALSQLGFNKIAAAGVIGNAYQESSLDPSISGQGAAGLLQWTPGSDLFGPAAAAGQPWQSIGFQMALAARTIGAGGVSAMNASGSPAAAATWFMNNFERPGIPDLGNRIAGANQAFAEGYARGGFVTKIIKPPKGKTPPKPKVPKAGKQTVTSVSNKDLETLSKVGGKVSGLEIDIANRLAQYSSMSSRFSVLEQNPAFLNADGSINTAGLAQTTSDDKQLLAMSEGILGDYNAELPLVSGQLKKWLGSQAKTQGSINKDDSTIVANKKKMATNKLKESSIRTALLDLTKPTKNTVKQIEDQIKSVKLGWDNKVTAAEKAKLDWDMSSTPRELQLEQSVINAARRKLSSSTLGTADRLKQTVLNEEAAEHAYTGKDKTIKQSLSQAVDAARANYSEFLLGQAPVKAAASAASQHASLALRQYLLDEKPTKQQLTDAVSSTRLDETAALSPLEGALLAANVAQQQRQQKIKAESFSLRQQLNSLTSEDTKLTTKDSSISTNATSLKAVLSGAGGATSTNATVAALETVAGKLGTVMWGGGGSFSGINTTGQGAAYDEQTTIYQLENTLGTLGGEAAAVAAASAAGASTAATADNTAEIQLLQQMNLQLSEALALNESQTSVLAGMIPDIPSYDTGGPIMRDTLAMVHEGEYVVPKGGALVGSSGQASQQEVHIHQHYHGNAGALMDMMDQRIAAPQNVTVVSKQLGRRTQLLRR